MHLDKSSRDGKVYLEEFNSSLHSIKMVDVPLPLVKEHFRQIKDRSKGYFTKE